MAPKMSVSDLCDLFDGYLPVLFQNIKKVRDTTQDLQADNTLPMALPTQEQAEFNKLVGDMDRAFDQNQNRIILGKLEDLKIAVKAGEVPEALKTRANGILSKFELAQNSYKQIREEMVKSHRECGAKAALVLALHVLRFARFLRRRVYPAARLLSDIFDLHNVSGERLRVTSINMDRLQCEVSIESSAPEGLLGEYPLRLVYTLPPSYPSLPPSVRIIPPLFHPNVDPFSGFVHYSGPQGEESPSSVTLENIIENLQELLVSPDLECPHPSRSPEDLELFRNNPQQALQLMSQRFLQAAPGASSPAGSPRSPKPASVACMQLLNTLRTNFQALLTEADSSTTAVSVRKIKHAVQRNKEQQQQRLGQLKAEVLEGKRPVKGRQGDGDTDKQNSCWTPKSNVKQTGRRASFDDRLAGIARSSTLPSMAKRMPNAFTAEDFRDILVSSTIDNFRTNMPASSTTINMAAIEQLAEEASHLDQEDPRSPTIGVPRTPCAPRDEIPLSLFSPGGARPEQEVLSPGGLLSPGGILSPGGPLGPAPSFEGEDGDIDPLGLPSSINFNVSRSGPMRLGGVSLAPSSHMISSSSTLLPPADERNEAVFSTALPLQVVARVCEYLPAETVRTLQHDCGLWCYRPPSHKTDIVREREATPAMRAEAARLVCLCEMLKEHQRLCTGEIVTC